MCYGGEMRIKRLVILSRKRKQRCHNICINLKKNVTIRVCYKFILPTITFNYENRIIVLPPNNIIATRVRHN